MEPEPVLEVRAPPSAGLSALMSRGSGALPTLPASAIEHHGDARVVSEQLPHVLAHTGYVLRHDHESM
jgi:hypothetical protein